jgi:hypothetical protein
MPHHVRTFFLAYSDSLLDNTRVPVLQTLDQDLDSLGALFVGGGAHLQE